ncbi:MAG: ABC transporter substrate-binding protein [Propionibacteriaceae bacterium]|nr:ABC transporter substrate-binding protein [Propionibacteriaceae bacterium]
MKRLLGLAATCFALTLTTGCVVTGTQSSAPESSAGGPRLRVALNFAPVAELSPYTDDASSLMRLGVSEALIAIDADGAPQPALAEKFEMVDEQTARFTLRKGVRFHDDSPVTATAVAASLNAALKADPAPSTVSGRELTITAEGEEVVVVQAAKADPILIMRFANPDMVILAPKAYEQDPNKPNPIDAGTGPFELTALNGTTHATLEANPGYWAGAPKAAGLDVQFISKADARVNAMRAGELDVFQNVPVAQLPNMTGFTVESRPIPRTSGLYLNTRSGVFADAGLRVAAAKAIQGEVIASTIFEGHAEAAQGIFRGDVEWTKDRQAPAYAEAKDAAGVSITIATYSDRPELPEAVTVIADQLRSAGFTVETPVVKEYSVLEPEIMAGAYDMVLLSRMYMSKANDPLSLMQLDFTCEGGYNLSFLCDPAVDQVIAEASTNSDVAARREAAVKAEALVLGQGAYIPVVHEQVRIGRVNELSGLAQDPLEWKMITEQTTIDR